MNLVRISTEAEADLDAIWLYIANDSPIHADRFLERLIKTLTTTLSTLPLVGRKRDEFEIGLYSFPVEGYIAFYRVRKDVVEIVRIIHGARDLDAIFSS
jgi:toxin ParE1/3/4